VLVIPRQHIAGLSEVTPEQAALLGKLVLAAKRAATETGVAEGGYRVVVNSGPNAGQSVFHLHVHMLGGRSLGWPPG
jgi:histidine triad (HIT) family protein